MITLSGSAILSRSFIPLYSSLVAIKGITVTATSFTACKILAHLGFCFNFSQRTLVFLFDSVLFHRCYELLKTNLIFFLFSQEYFDFNENYINYVKNFIKFIIIMFLLKKT